MDEPQKNLIKLKLNQSPLAKGALSKMIKDGVIKFSPEELEIETMEEHGRDRQGILFSDVNAFFDMSILEIIKNNIQNFKAIKKECGLKMALSFIQFRNFNSWLWVIEPMSYYKEEHKIINTPKDHAGQDLIKGLVYIGPGIYVQTNDPTLLVVDEDRIPFDMKHGWSNKKIGDIISLWVYYIYDIKLPSKLR